MGQTPTIIFLRSKLFALMLVASALFPSITSAQVQVIMSGTNVTCAGQCNGTATALGSGGWAPHTYLWSTGQTSATISGLCPGTYFVTVTDIDLGTGVGSITITQPTQLGVTVGGQSQICGNVPDGKASAVPFGGTPPYTYLWNNGATTPEITGLAAGTYTVTVTDALGCTTAGSFVVGFWDEGVWLMTSHTDVTCFGFNNGTAHVSVMSGTAPYTYDWSNDGPENPDNDIDDIVGLAPGTYTVTVTDANGCSNQTSVVIAQPQQLICTATSTPANCGALGTATISFTGGTGPHTYQWSFNNQTTPTISVPAGFYSATVTDVKACTCSSGVQVVNNNNALTVNVSVNSSAGCLIGGSASASVFGGSGNYTYLWDSNPPQNTQSATNLSAGPHSVTVTDLNTGCQGIGNVVIPSSSAVVVTATVSANATCLVGGSATASATGGSAPYTFDWSNNGPQNPDTDQATVLNLLAGPYTVTITDAGGCTGSAAITILQTSGPTVTVTVNANATCVSGGSATATASGGVAPYTYQWSASANNQTTATATNLAPGVHGVTVTDVNGCAATGSVTITQPGAPTAIISSSSPSGCGGNTGSATAGGTGGTGGFTFDWSNDGPDVVDNDPATVTGLSAGTYTVTITDAAGCTSTASISIAASFPPTVVITASTNANCSNPGSATASVSGGTGPFTYLWTSGETTATAINLNAGVHTVTVTDAAGCIATASVTIGSTNNGIKIGDYVWYDSNQDGFQQLGETNGVNNVTVKLMKAGNDNIFGTPDDITVQTTVTNVNGFYTFDCVTPGNYILMFSGIPAGYEWTTKDFSTNDCKDSDVKQNGKTDAFIIAAGQSDNPCFDAGIHTICDALISGGSICCNQTICEGETPALITNSLTPFGGSGPISYMWLQFISIGGAPPNWVPVPNSMSASYQPGALFETTRFIRCARRDGCDHWEESNYVEITVLPAGSPGCSGFMSDFRVNQQGPSSIEVSWSTLPEATEYMYTVQHSTNGAQWTNLSSVLGKQDPLQNNAYTFMHETPASGKNIYRIKRATAGGQIAYSDMKEINIAFTSSETVRISPNPVVDKLTIMNLLVFNDDVTVVISSTKGDILHTVTLKKGKMEEIELKVTDLPSGIYLARINFADGSSKTLKITKI